MPPTLLLTPSTFLPSHLPPLAHGKRKWNNFKLQPLFFNIPSRSASDCCKNVGCSCTDVYIQASRETLHNAISVGLGEEKGEEGRGWGRVGRGRALRLASLDWDGSGRERIGREGKGG